MSSPHYTAAALAELYGVKVDTVLAWIHAGELAAVDVSRPGSQRPRWRISADAVEAFERRRRAVPHAANHEPRSRDRESVGAVRSFV